MLQVDLISLQIIYLKLFLILNKFLLLREFLKRLFFFIDPLGNRCHDVEAKTDVTHLIKVDHCSVLCFQNIDFHSDMARVKYLVILSGTCVAANYTCCISQKYLIGDGKHAENKEIYPSFKKVETKSVINNVSAYPTDSITPDFRLKKGYRFLIRCHRRLQTFSKQRCLLLRDSLPTLIFYKAHRVLTALFKLA